MDVANSWKAFYRQLKGKKTKNEASTDTVATKQEDERNVEKEFKKYCHG